MNPRVWYSYLLLEKNDNPPKLGRNRRSRAESKSQVSSKDEWYASFTVKRCPNVLGWLHKIAGSNRKISEQWVTAKTVYILKEQNSTEINQFRPISLLNVEGKIFLSVTASRLKKYLTENGYINTLVEKGDIPRVSGCLEHATVIWEAIQRARSEKLNIYVVWLDLANAYGSVP